MQNILTILAVVAEPTSEGETQRPAMIMSLSVIPVMPASQQNLFPSLPCQSDQLGSAHLLADSTKPRQSAAIDGISSAL